MLARRIEREQRLIGEDELGVVGQRLGLADELLLAAGKLADAAVAQAGGTYLGEELVDAVAGRAAASTWTAASDSSRSSACSRPTCPCAPAT